MLAKIFQVFLLVVIPTLIANYTGCAVAQVVTPLSEGAQENSSFETIEFPYSYSGTNMPFISHRGSGAFDNTLAINLPLKPIVAINENF